MASIVKSINDKLFINSAGNVGIGTNSPLYKLNVIGDISFPSRNTAGTYRIGMGREDGSGWTYAQNIAFISDGGGGYITFSTQEPGVGGGEYMRLNYTGNLLIGTTTDAGYKLDVSGTARTTTGTYLGTSSGNVIVGGTTSDLISGFKFIAIGNTAVQYAASTGTYLRIEPGAADTQVALKADARSGAYPPMAFHTSDTERLRITAAGNVGIGTTNPYEVLDIVGNIRLGNYPTAGTRYIGYANNTFGSQFIAGMSIESTTLGGNYSQKLNFATHYYGVSAGVRMTIDEGGNVGIGTATPESKLHVASGDVLISNGQYYTAESNTGGNYKLAGLTSGNVIVIGAIDYTTAGTIFAGGDSVSITTGGVAGSTRIYINSSGNVGINTTTPQKPLEVISNANDFVSVGVNQISVGNWTGIHFGYREANTNYRKSAIVFERTDLTANDAQGKIHILNGPQGSSGSATLADAKLTIAENGNVGIGTTAPQAPLHVIAASNTNDALIQEWSYTSGTIDAYSLMLKQTVTSGVVRYNFSMVNASTAYNDVLVLDRGNVGIGTTAPATKLNVGGIIRGESTTWEGSIISNSNGTSYSSFGWYQNATKRWSFYNDDNSSNALKLANQSGAVSMTFLQGGNVGINTTNPSYKLHTVGDAYFTSFTGVGTTPSSSWSFVVDALAGTDGAIKTTGSVLINTGALGVNITPSATAGRIDASNDIVAYSTSDERFKENITPIANALDKVKTLTGVEFDWKMETKDYHGYVGHDVGVIAQQVKAVLPEAVRTNANGYLAVRYEKIIGLLVEAMKEQQAQIEELKSKLK